MKPAHKLALALLLAAAAAVYWPGVHGPLVLDDATNIGPAIAFANHQLSLGDVLLDKHLTVFGRSLSHLSFVYDALVWGTDPAVFRTVNLVIHLLCGLLVFRISRLLFRRDPAMSNVAIWAALAVTACWLSAPMFVSTVLYVVQRMAQLSTLFALFGLLLYVEGRERLDREQAGAAWHLFLGVPLCLALGFQAKENIIVLPGLLLLVEIFLFSAASLRKPGRMQVLLFFALIAVLPLSAALSYLALHPELVIKSYQHRDFTLTERLMTEMRVLWDYVSVLLLPSGAKMGLVHDDFPLSRGWLSPVTTLWAALAWAGVVSASIILYARRHPTIPLGILFFLVAHGMESTVLPLEIYFEHRNYLPALGLYLAVVAGIVGVAQRLPRGDLFLRLMAVAILPVYLLATHARSSAWSDPNVNLLAALEHHPDSPRLLSGAADLMAATGKIDVALQLTQRAERVAPRQRAAWLLLRYRISCMAELVPSKELLTAMDQIPRPEISHQLTYQFQRLVREIGSERCPEAEASRLAGIVSLWTERGIKPNASRVKSVRRNLGELLVIDQREADALDQFQAAVLLGPGDCLDRFLLAGQLQQLGRNEEAVREFLIGESLLRKGSRQYETMRHILRYRLGMAPYFWKWLATNTRWQGAMRRDKPQLLVVTSTFPETSDSTQPDFVLQLCARLRDRFGVTVLAPDQPDTPSLTNFNGLGVLRFRYWIKPYQTLSGDSGISARLRQRPWRLLLIPLFVVAEVMAIRRLLNTGDFDLVHAHWILPQGACALLANRLLRHPLPVLTTAHGADVYALQWPGLSSIKSWVLRHSAAVAAVSSAMQADLRTLVSPDPLEINVLPMGVDLQNHFVPGQQKKDCCQVLFVGRLVPKKGVHHLITALGTIIGNFGQAHLIVVGSGPEEGRLRQLTSSLDLDDRVTFHGAATRQQVVELMQASGIVVVPSITAADGDQEGLGLVTIEAMGCGCAVIAHDFAAVHDVILNDKNGVLVPQGDEAALGEALSRLLSDPELQQKLGVNGRQSVLEQFDWKPAADRYANLIDKILAETSGQ